MFYRIGTRKVSEKFTRKHLRWTYFVNKVAKSDSTSAKSNERILQRVTSDFLQRATFATSNKQILQRVTSDFLQQTISAMSNE